MEEGVLIVGNPEGSMGHGGGSISPLREDMILKASWGTADRATTEGLTSEIFNITLKCRNLKNKIKKKELK